jgi:glycosyltransferase involved in cell wall biosynthesis
MPGCGHYYPDMADDRAGFDCSGPPLASIVIPAHNEEVAIRRLLGAILSNATSGEFEVVVVCNGCNDGTADVAREFGADVLVVELAEPSKRQAMKQGDATARHFPRLYVDADVQLGTRDVRALVRSLQQPEVLACAPSRVLQRTSVSRLVRAYYDVWERLPQVQSGLFGRGVVAINEAGFARIRDLPPVMSDDLALSEAFTMPERVVVEEAHVLIWLPRTIRGLIRRRIRANTGTAQIDATTGRPAEDKTSVGVLVRIARADRAAAPKVLVFVGVAIIARFGARRKTRRGDFDTWLRDDSRDAAQT